MALALFGAIIVLVTSAISTLYAMKKIGSIAELISAKDIKKFPYSLVFMGIAETPIIYALLYSILIFINMKNFSDDANLFLLISSPILALSSFFGGIGIGKVSQASLAAIYKDKSLFAKTLVFVAFPETIIIYGLLISLLILFSVSKLTLFNTILISILMSASSITAYFLAYLGVKGIRGIVENTRSFSYSLILTALPESVAIYLLLISLMILMG